MPRPRVLVVDDEPKIVEAVTRALAEENFTVLAAATGEEAFFLLHKEALDAVVLDVSLPRCSGLDILEVVRKEGSPVPVLLLTSHNTPEDRVHGLNAGADDYLGKPFSLPELVARIRALLRRGGAPAPQPARITIGDLILDADAHAATRAGVRLELTGREFALLLYLAEQGGRIASRDMLAKHVWHETARFTPIHNVIDVQIARLRRKVDDPYPTRLLHTVRGVGFALREGEP